MFYIFIDDDAYTFANGVDDTCYSDTYNCRSNSGGNPSSSWLYKSGTRQWTVSSRSGNANYVFFIANTGFFYSNLANNNFGVRPVLYLRSDIKLQGSGGSDDPYVIVE